MNFIAKGNTLPLGEKTYIMAVINATPDSFFAGSRVTAQTAAQCAAQAVDSGADIIDLGAQSTAPNSVSISADEELERLLPALEAIRAAVKVPISVDTFFAEVASAALEHGADIVNDVSGTASEAFAQLVKKHSAGWIIMHTGGKKSNESAEYTSGVIDDINSFFARAYETAAANCVSAQQLCFDPGIGFGKTRDDDLAIIKSFNLLNLHGCAGLAALSRKRVTRMCGDELCGTLAADTACILGGADIIRVHDVREAAAAARMTDLLRGYKYNG